LTHQANWWIISCEAGYEEKILRLVVKGRAPTLERLQQRLSATGHNRSTFTQLAPKEAPYRALAQFSATAGTILSTNNRQVGIEMGVYVFRGLHLRTGPRIRDVERMVP
jgi:hypothetical protein